MRTRIVEKIISAGAVAVIRLEDPARALPVIDAVIRGGMTSVEITMTTPGALKIIETLTGTYGEQLLVGVGSVLNVQTAVEAIRAGARYVVSPVFIPEIIEVAHKKDIPALPGCFTPTEIYNAHVRGADIVKVFPADVNGMRFFKSILAPMPFLRLMPTGGVSLTNADKWLCSGACAVGVGGALTDKQAVADGNYKKIEANAKRLMDNIKRIDKK